MRFNRKGKEHRAYKDALVQLSNSVSLRAMTTERVLDTLATVLHCGEAHDLRKELPKLISRQEVDGALMLESWTLDSLLRRPAYGLPDASLVDLHVAILRSRADVFESFGRQARRFENSLIKGLYAEAHAILDEVQKSSGWSMWVIRGRITAFAQQGRIEEMKEYTEELRSSILDDFAKFLVNAFLMIATDPTLHSRVTIPSNIRELQQANLTEWSDLLTLMFQPSPSMVGNKSLSCIRLFQRFPAIDQFCLLQNLLANEDMFRRLSPEESSLKSSLDRSMNQGAESWCKSEEYESGRYQDVISSYLSSSGAQIYRGACLAAKAMEHCGWVSSSPSPGVIQEIIGALRGAYSLEHSPTLCREVIQSAILQLHYLPSGASLQLIAFSAFPNHYSVNDRAKAALLVRCREGIVDDWQDGLERSKSPLLDLDYTCRASELPDFRRAKADIRRKLREGVAYSAISPYLDIYRQTCPLPRDYYELASAVCERMSELGSLVSICADSLATSPNAFASFPMRALANFIEATGLCDLESIIVLYFYVKNVDPAKDYLLNEYYEEYLHLNEIARPTDLGFDGVDRPKLHVLLRDISVQETLDSLGVFKNSSEVRAERMRILDALLADSAIDVERHRSEVDEMLSQAIVETGAAQFNAHKIYVNDSAIKRKVLDDVSSLYSLYIASDGAEQGKFIQVDAADSKAEAAALVTGDKNTILLKIFTLIKDSFLYDEKHGLDKNLSAEIRHGFFGNKMRSRLEEHHLITEKDSSGDYKRNNYWEEINALLTDEAISQVDACLGEFSAEFNSLISTAESWMKVASDEPDSARIFNYDLYLSEFEPLMKRVDSAQTAEEVADFALDVLWEQTEINLSAMRDKIDSVLRTNVDLTFERLIDRLDSVRGGAPISDLFAAINRARNEIKEDISAVAQWFKRGGASTISARSLQEVIAISIECYNRARGIHVRPSIELDFNEILINLEGRQVRSFVLALMNLYENCVRHSGYGIETPISVKASGGANSWLIEVSNPVVEAVFDKLAQGGLTHARERMNGPAFAGLVRTEGGSGLRKVCSQLSEIAESTRVTIGSSDKSFSVVIANA